MSSNTPAGGNAIRIPVIAELDPITGQLKSLKQIAHKEATAAGEAIKKGLGGGAAAAADEVAKSAKSNAFVLNTTARHAEGMRITMRGIQPSITAATQAFSLLGAKANPILSTLSHGIATIGLYGATGPAVVIGAIAAGIGALVVMAQEAETPLDRLNRSLEAIGKRQGEITKAQTASGLEISAVQEARTRGITAEQVATERLIKSQEKARATATQTFVGLGLKGNWENATSLWGKFKEGGFKEGTVPDPDHLTDEAIAMRKAAGEIETANSIIEDANAGLTAFLQNQTDLRIEAFRVETATRVATLGVQAKTLRDAGTALRAQDKVNSDGTLNDLQRLAAGIEVQRAAALRAATQGPMRAIDVQEATELAKAGNNETLKAELRARFEGLRGVTEAGLKPVLDAINAQFDKQLDVAQSQAFLAIEQHNLQVGDAEKKAASSILDLKRDSQEQQLADLKLAEAVELREAKKHGYDRAMIAEKFGKLREGIEAKYATLSGQRELVSEREALVLNDRNSSFGQGFDAHVATIKSQRKTGAEIGATLAEGMSQPVEDGFKSAISGALQSNSETDWSAMLRGLFDSVRGGIADAMAQGLVEAIGIKQASASLWQELFGVASTAAAGAAGGTGVPTKSAMKGGSDSIVVVNSFSEADADAFAAKMSSRGARVVVAKHSGQGVTAGSIPSRRRR